MGEVKLLGTWPSAYSYRVIWALKLKAIPFEYLEQDLFNKSSMLLQYNPVHKKIPVLLHAGNPIIESSIILEYLDELWPQHPLLPAHPYHTALSRFWVKYVDDKGAAISVIYLTSGEQQKKAMNDTLEMLQVIEEEAMGLLGDHKYFGGESVGIFDLALAIILWLQAIEIALEIQLFEPHKFPKLHSWVQNFKQAPVICENIPDPQQLVAFFKSRREIILGSASA